MQGMIQGMNKLIFTVSIFLSAMFGYWLGDHQHIDVAPESNVIFENDDKEKLLEKIKNLTTDNEKLIADKYSRAQSSLPSKEKPQKIAVETASDFSSVNPSAGNIAKEEYELKERASAFTNWLTKSQQEKPWFDLGVEMEGRFEAEEKNFTWADQEESQIQTLFGQDKSLSGIALKSASCKSTQCQLKVGVADQEQANQVAMAISKTFGENNFSQIIIDSRITQGEAVFYVTRNEKGFELN